MGGPGARHAGEKELAAKDDPTFESVCRISADEAAARGRRVKDHPHDVGIAPDGAPAAQRHLFRRQAAIAFLEIGEPATRFGSAKPPCARRLLNGWMPIVVTSDEHDGLKIEQTTYGYTKTCRRRAAVCHVRIKLTNAGQASRKVKLCLPPQPASEKSPPFSTELEVPAGGDNSVCLSVPFAILESPARPIPAAEFDQKLRK